MNWLSKLVRRFCGTPRRRPQGSSEWDIREGGEKAKAEIRSRVAAIDVGEMTFDDASIVYDFVAAIMQENTGRNYITQNDLILSFYWIDKALKLYISSLVWDKCGNEETTKQITNVVELLDSSWMTMLGLYVPDEIVGNWQVMPDGHRPPSPIYVLPPDAGGSYESNKDYYLFCLTKAKTCPEFDYKVFTRHRAFGYHLKYQAEEELKRAERIA